MQGLLIRTSVVLKRNACLFAIPRMTGTIGWPETALLAIFEDVFSVQATIYLYFYSTPISWVYLYTLLWRDPLGNETISSTNAASCSCNFDILKSTLMDTKAVLKEPCAA